jgi:hypothetical protein
VTFGLGNRCSIRLSYGTLCIFNGLEKAPTFERLISHEFPPDGAGRPPLNA